MIVANQCQSALAVEDEYGIEHPAPPKRSAKDSSEPEYTGTVTSIEAMRTGFSDRDSTPEVLAMMAEYNLKHGDPDKALRLIKISLEKDYQDIDVHKVYAEILERKWNTDTPKNPDVYNACVMEWLIIMRQEVGWEKLTTNGIGIPGLGKFYEDEDQVIPAKQHLLTLTGVLPKVWENDTKYLKKVLKPSTSEVSGKILPKKAVGSDTGSDTGSDAAATPTRPSDAGHSESSKD